MLHLPSIPALPSPRPHRQDIRWDRRLPGRLLVATVALALAACESANPAEHRDVAIVAHMDFSDPGDPQPEIPETATAGVPLEIAFRTRGGGCVRRIDRTEVVRGRESAVVTPYDVLGVSPVCTDDIRFLLHSASVVFDEPGTRKGRPSIQHLGCHDGRPHSGRAAGVHRRGVPGRDRDTHRLNPARSTAERGRVARDGTAYRPHHSRGTPHPPPSPRCGDQPDDTPFPLEHPPTGLQVHTIAHLRIHPTAPPTPARARSADTWRTVRT